VDLKIPNCVPRSYQLPAFQYWDRQGTAGRAVEVWARRLGKDFSYMHIAAMKSCDRRGLYLHMLPEFAHARRAIWDGMTNEGDRMIDVAFPPEMRANVQEHEMRIELHNGSVWQLGGSDQYDRWLSSNPVSIVFSEFATAHPKGWEIMRPILRANGGWAAFISTPRGYNHLYRILQLAKTEPGWRSSVITAIEAGVMTQADIDQEIRLGMPEELARQEYLCDFSAGNVGAILGRYIEAADRGGRLTRNCWDSGGERIDISADLGRRDATALWFWQRWADGFALVDYDEDTQLDAEQWIERIADKAWKLGTIYLPHDARAKTFATRHSAMEQFLHAKRTGKLPCERIVIVPQVRTADRINAARTVLPLCRFDKDKCEEGLLALREWSFAWNDDKRNYSSEPDHNWASHGADAFTYGALMLKAARPAAAPKPKPLPVAIANFTLEQLWEERERYGQRHRLQ
jgi:phage terminase large subunit